MLTGDGVDVAIAVARRCQIIAVLDRVAFLDYDHDAQYMIGRTICVPVHVDGTSVVTPRPNSDAAVLNAR